MMDHHLGLKWTYPTTAINKPVQSKLCGSVGEEVLP